MFKLNIVLLTFISILYCCLAQYAPTVLLSNGLPPQDTYTLSLKQNDPRLPTQLNGVGFFCHISGVWIFYQYGYNYEGVGWIQSRPKCSARPNSNANPIDSVGFLESSRNSGIPTINLFQVNYWGRLLDVSVFTESVSNYTGIVRSTVVTGNSSVTFYKSENYDDESICLEEALGEELASYQGATSWWGFGPTDIKSFRFGCYSSRRFRSGGASREFDLQAKTMMVAEGDRKR